MKAQKPAEGILKRSEWGDSKFYTVMCECGDESHSHNVCVDADDHRVSVTIYTTVKSKWWSMARWQKMWTLLTKGYVEYEADLIMTQQQALNYAEILKSAVNDVAEFRKTHNTKEKT